MKMNKSKLKNWRYWVSVPFLLLAYLCIFLAVFIAGCLKVVSNFLYKADTNHVPKWLKNWSNWIDAGDRE